MCSLSWCEHCLQALYRLAALGAEDEIQVPAATMRCWFDSLIDPIIAAVHSSLSRASDQGCPVDYMLIVGGFGGSPYFIKRIRAAFEAHVTRIVCPGVPSESVLQGIAS